MPRRVGTIELVIDGQEVGDHGPIISHVTSITMDSSYRSFLADCYDDKVLIFSPTGKYEASIGREGQGPGDLSRPCSIGLDSNGRLWIAEMGNQRYSVYDVTVNPPDLLTVVNLPVPVNRMSDDPVSWDQLGHLVHVSVFLPFDGKRYRLVRSLVDSTGDVVGSDTLHQAPMDRVGEAVIMGRNGATGVRQPFGPMVLRAFGPQGMQAEALSSEYAVNWFDGDHKLLHRLQRTVQGPGVSRGERSRAESTLKRIAERLGVRRSTIPFEVPQRKAPLVALGFDLDGRLWVERSVTEGSPREADVFDAEGRWVATMVWPANVRLSGWAVRGDVGTGVATDTLGVQQAVGLRFR